MNEPLRFWLMGGLLAAGLVLWARCDAVTPEEPARLVVEAFVEAGKPLPGIRLWQTVPLERPYPFDAATAVADAHVVLVFDGVRIPYSPVAGQPGRYAPAAEPPRPVAPRARLAFEARWGTQLAVAETTVPPVIKLDSLHVEVPDEPVDGIILDSLFIDPVKLDSLQLDSLRTGAEQGLVYLVEVTLWWSVGFAEAGPDSAYWVRTQLKPFLPTRPTFDDFFFRPEQIVRERRMARDARGRHTWTGVYAVPVERQEEPLPAHTLRVALIRSGEDYARYTASRTDPERREPTTNVQGAIGIVAGLSIDSLRVRVE